MTGFAVEDHTLSFRNSFPLVLLPPGGAVCYFPDVRPKQADPLPWQEADPTWALLVAVLMAVVALMTTPWVLLVLPVLLVLLRPKRHQRLQSTDARLRDRVSQVRALLPAGNASQGQFDHHLAILVCSKVRGLLACRRGPHLQPLCGLNRFPDLVLVTASGVLLAVEIDEPWHWEGKQRVLSHEAGADMAKTQALLAKGVVVIRLAEQQVAETGEACVQLLQSVVKQLQTSGMPDSSTFHQQLPWPCDRLPLYRDPSRLNWPRPQVRGYVRRPVKRQGRSPNP